jgi:large subunit ribosomal protein L10
MKRTDKERVVAELAERLRSTDTLLVADYRGLSMPQIDELRTRLLEHGARFSVVKNTLTRRAAEEAGVDALLALLEGPTAIAFLEAGGDPVETAKALAAAARETRILVLRGGILDGRPMSAADVEELAKLPPLEGLRGQVLGAIVGPLNALLGLVSAPLQDLHGLLEARIEQLGGEGAGDTGDTEEETPAAEASASTAAEEEER